MHPTEVKVLDINASYHGVPQAQLMENAGRKVMKAAKKHFEHSQCLVVCGSGNNGGDGLVAARYLATSSEVKVVLIKEPSSLLSRTNLRRLKRLGVPVLRYDNQTFPSLVNDSDLVIDAMLGIGISGPPRPPFDTVIRIINDKAQAVLSVDIPSGLNQSPCVQPDITVTFHDVKDGMSADNSGIIEITDIGIPSAAAEQVGPGDMAFYPRSDPRSHKGQNGVVITIGGGPFTGAPALAALAALRAGTDLSIVVTPEQVQPIIASFSPDLITVPLPGEILCPAHCKKIRSLFKKAGALVLGPGLGNDEKTHAALEEIIDAACAVHMPLVVDADAIGVFGNRSGGDITVLTPHPRELNDLTGCPLPDDSSGRKEAVREAAAQRNSTILLKGFEDIVSDGRTIKINRVHNVGMTVGGTGDVLSGITGALLSKGVPGFNAARMAAFMNGSAGNLAFARKRFGMTAADLLDALPLVLSEYL